MKRLIVCLLLIAAITVLLIATSCSRYCDPANIKSGRSNQHHDSKPFKAKIINTQRQGHSCYVKYMNMQQVTYRLYDNCDCKKFQLGNWVKL
jgi:hypothetical protein